MKNTKSIIRKVSVGFDHVLYLTKNGAVIAKGKNDYGQCNVSGWNNIVSVAAGHGFSVALKSDGTLIATGKNDYYQCDVSSWGDVIAITANENRVFGARSDGKVLFTGKNYFHQCNPSSWEEIVDISAGKDFVLGLKKDGTVVATGDNSYGQGAVSGWRDIVAIAAGAYHSVGLMKSGRMIASGNNEYGQCNVSDWKGILEISAGDEHTVSFTNDGRVLATGHNQCGQCNTSDWNGIEHVSAGYDYSVALKSDGTIISTNNAYSANQNNISLKSEKHKIKEFDLKNHPKIFYVFLALLVAFVLFFFLKPKKSVDDSVDILDDISGRYSDKIQEGIDLFNDGKIYHSLLVLDEAIEIDPEKADAYSKIIDIYLNDNDFDNAEMYIDKAIDSLGLDLNGSYEKGSQEALILKKKNAIESARQIPTYIYSSYFDWSYQLEVVKRERIIDDNGDIVNSDWKEYSIEETKDSDKYLYFKNSEYQIYGNNFLRYIKQDEWEYDDNVTYDDKGIVASYRSYEKHEDKDFYNREEIDGNTIVTFGTEYDPENTVFGYQTITYDSNNTPIHYKEEIYLNEEILYRSGVVEFDIKKDQFGVAVDNSRFAIPPGLGSVPGVDYLFFIYQPLRFFEEYDKQDRLIYSRLYTDVYGLPYCYSYAYADNVDAIRFGGILSKEIRDVFDSVAEYPDYSPINIYDGAVFPYCVPDQGTHFSYFKHYYIRKNLKGYNARMHIDNNEEKQQIEYHDGDVYISCIYDNHYLHSFMIGDQYGHAVYLEVDKNMDVSDWMNVVAFGKLKLSVNDIKFAFNSMDTLLNSVGTSLDQILNKDKLVDLIKGYLR